MNDTLAILEKVHLFYTTSFGQLVTYTAALLAFVGVLLPLFIAIQQSRQTRREKEALELALNAQVGALRLELQAEVKDYLTKASESLNKSIEETRKDIESKLEQLEDLSKARIFHLQANQQSQKAQYAGAASDAANAVNLYAKVPDEHNLQRAWVTLEESIVFLTEKDLQLDSNPWIEATLKEALESVSKLDGGSGRYSDRIAETQRMFTAAKKRKPPTNT
jgi:hypothetical protein